MADCSLAVDDGALTAPVTALSHQPRGQFLLVGMANVLRIFSTKTSQQLYSGMLLPPSESIHGCFLGVGDNANAPYVLLLYGVREMRVFTCEQKSPSGLLDVSPAIITHRFERRVLCVSLLLQARGASAGLGVICAGLDDNSVMWLNCTTQSTETMRIRCKDELGLFAMALLPIRSDDARQTLDTGRVLAVGGSAFKTVVVWDASMPSSAAACTSPVLEVRTPLCHLRGHEGAVHRVRFSPRGLFVASVSDDRRLILWRTPQLGGPQTATNAKQSAESRAEHSAIGGLVAASLFAHSSRVWDVAFMRESLDYAQDTCVVSVATAGEDALVKLWRLSMSTSCAIDGRSSTGRAPSVELLATLKGHAGKHVWSVANCGGETGECLALASGGADGAVKLWPLQQYRLGGADTAAAPASSATSEMLQVPSTSKDSRSSQADVRAVALLGGRVAIAATGSGHVWALHLCSGPAGSDGTAASTVATESLPREEPYTCLLHVDEGVRWSKLHVQWATGSSTSPGTPGGDSDNISDETHALVLVGSASGDVLLLVLRMSGLASYFAGSPSLTRESSPNGLVGSETAAQHARWRAHSTCVMQFAWMPSSAPQKEWTSGVGMSLASADSRGELAIWQLTGPQTPADVLHQWRPLPAAQRITALATTELVKLQQSDSEMAQHHASSVVNTSTISVLLCGGSAGALRACVLPARSADGDAHSEPHESDVTAIDFGTDTKRQGNAAAPPLAPAAAAEGAEILDSHGGQPMTALLVGQTSRGSVQTTVNFFSCGRNGAIHEYELSVSWSDQATDSARGRVALRLSVLRSWKCSDATTLEALVCTSDGSLAVLGFVQTEALLWHVGLRQQLERWPARGCRHPKDIACISHASVCVGESHRVSSFILVHANAGHVHVLRSGSDSQTSSQQQPLSRGCTVLQSFHGREILCTATLAVACARAAGHGSAHAPILFATGSEDNTIKLVQVDPHGAGAQQLNVEATLEGHPASIRSLALSSRCPPNDGADDGGVSHVLFSAGGKESIYVWRLQTQQHITPATAAPAAVLRPTLLCARTLPERNSSVAKRVGTAAHRADAEADKRYLSVAAAALTKCHLLAAGTSQAQVDVFTLHESEGDRAQLRPLGRFHSPCGSLLCMTIRVTKSAVLLLGGSTGGALTVWDLWPLLNVGSTSVPAQPLPSLNLQPVAQVQHHAMGCNCLCLLDGQLPTNDLLVVVSGGDDQAVGVCVLSAADDEDRGRNSSAVVAIRSVASTLRENVHSGGVRGVAALSSSIVVSVGADSRLIVWRVTMGSSLSLEMCCQAAIAIEQVHAISASTLRCDATEATAIVVGCGVQVLTISGLAGDDHDAPRILYA